MRTHDALHLADYRRRVHELYVVVRSGEASESTWRQWRTARDLLYGGHESSAIEVADRAAFSGLEYFPYDPTYRFFVEMEPSNGASLTVAHSSTGSTRFIPVGTVSLDAIGIGERLTVYWLDAYGGGLFLPFRDGTSGDTTYGGGRYLLDTVKGADLGETKGRLVLDFNYAYHPSCVYSSRWSCPLAPADNRLHSPVGVGERLRSND